MADLQEARRQRYSAALAERSASYVQVRATTQGRRARDREAFPLNEHDGWWRWYRLGSVALLDSLFPSHGAHVDEGA